MEATIYGFGWKGRERKREREDRSMGEGGGGEEKRKRERERGYATYLLFSFTKIFKQTWRSRTGSHARRCSGTANLIPSGVKTEDWNQSHDNE